MAAAVVRAAVAVVRSAVAGFVVSAGALAMTAAGGDPAGVPVAVVDAEGASFAGPTGSRKGDDDDSAVAPGGQSMGTWALRRARWGLCASVELARKLLSEIARRRRGHRRRDAVVGEGLGGTNTASSIHTGNGDVNEVCHDYFLGCMLFEGGERLERIAAAGVGVAAAKARALPLTDEPVYVLDGDLL
ncbi:hypothetical protein FB451DRAFT_1253073, partial [Mycena latifolia]